MVVLQGHEHQVRTGSHQACIGWLAGWLVGLLVGCTVVGTVVGTGSMIDTGWGRGWGRGCTGPGLGSVALVGRTRARTGTGAGTRARPAAGTRAPEDSSKQAIARPT